MKKIFCLMMLSLVSLININCKPERGAPENQVTRMVHSQKKLTFSASAGGQRSFYLSVPEGYSTGKRTRLLLIYAGTDATGKEMYEWFGKGWNENVKGLELLMGNTIFVYPDQKTEWDKEKGWELGANAGEYGGNKDIEFTRELVAYLKKEYAIDNDRVFATGHSWGGDMAAIVAAYLPETFVAVSPVAANIPYWLESEDGVFDNKLLAKQGARPAIWTFFGLKDDYFGKLSVNGAFGIRQNDFWLLRNDCSKTYSVKGETKRYTCSKPEVLLTLYAGGQYSGGGDLPNHYPPDYFFSEVSKWFLSF